MPPVRGYKVRAKPKLGPVEAFIDAILAADGRRLANSATRRIGSDQRILAELPGRAIAESTVRNHVRERRRTGRGSCDVRAAELWLGLGSSGRLVRSRGRSRRRTGQAAGVRMRSMASGAAFHRAYLRATQQAFLEAHELAFAYFGGVFRMLRYDNLTSAVKKILRGHRREETVRFVAFRSHWRFEAEFCTPAAAHEKGGIEGETGYFRRNHWVPIPSRGSGDSRARGVKWRSLPLPTATISPPCCAAQRHSR